MGQEQVCSPCRTDNVSDDQQGTTEQFFIEQKWPTPLCTAAGWLAVAGEECGLSYKTEAEPEGIKSQRLLADFTLHN